MLLPEDFIRYTREMMGNDLYQKFEQALAEEPPVSIRLNPMKTAGMGVVAGEQVPWCPTGFYLPCRPAFTFDPLLHAGAYYVQEASSMFLDLVLRQYVDQPVLMLDLCAAPGGKSTVARAALPDSSLLFSNEPIHSRAQILSENIQKFGLPDVIVTNNYPADYRNSGILFDVILTDVPCSGEGMFRKDPATINEWSAHHVGQCAQLQREIVADAWSYLRDGGLLIYSTCTFNTKENEENIRWATEELGAEVLGVDIRDAWGITGSLLAGFNAPVYRFIPGVSRGEGLFMAVMRKQGEQGTATKPPEARKRAGKRLNVLLDGIKPPMQKGKDSIPDHSEALAVNRDSSRFPTVSLTYEQAIAYLRKEAITLPSGSPRGICVVTYEGLPLGFAKNIGNRANNLYPTEWRIRSTHVPESRPHIIKKT